MPTSERANISPPVPDAIRVHWYPDLERRLNRIDGVNALKAYYHFGLLKQINPQGYFSNGSLNKTIPLSPRTRKRTFDMLIKLGWMENKGKGYRLISYTRVWRKLGLSPTIYEGKKGRIYRPALKFYADTYQDFKEQLLTYRLTRKHRQVVHRKHCVTGSGEPIRLPQRLKSRLTRDTTMTIGLRRIAKQSGVSLSSIFYRIREMETNERIRVKRSTKVVSEITPMGAYVTSMALRDAGSYKGERFDQYKLVRNACNEYGF